MAVQQENETVNKIAKELEKAGFDFAVAVATQGEVEAGAACGQLCLIVEQQKK